MRKLFTLLTGFALWQWGHTQTITAYPYNEDFESFATCGTGYNPACALGAGWTNATGDQSNWATDIGGTPSAATGPDVDHNPGTAAGKYLYFETSGGVTGNVTNLVSPYFNFSALTAPTVSIWYHMLGATMGTMHLDVHVGVNGVWTLDVVPGWTDNIDLWQEKVASLVAYAGLDSVQFRIRGVQGTSFTSDMAVDDISVFQPAPYDFSTIYANMPNSGCGLGIETAVGGFYNNGSMTIAAGLSLLVNYNDGTNSDQDTIVLSAPWAPGDTLVHNFTNLDFSVPGTYNAMIWVTDSINNGNDTANGMLVSKPTVSAFPYFDNFESGAPGWTINNGTLGTWALGTPAATVINSAASGVNAFTTNLTGNYNNSDNSYVESPCFDFTNNCNPSIEFDIWWHTELSWDGAVLQSSIDGGLTWQNVGALNDPDNWYNDNTINGNPGGQQIGWSGNGTTGSNGWVNAKHYLTGLGGLSNVTLRVAFGADPSVNGYNGFAFDNVLITDTPPVELSTAYVTMPNSGCGLGMEDVTAGFVNGGCVSMSIGDTVVVSYNDGTNMVTDTVVLSAPLGIGDTYVHVFSNLNFSVTTTYNAMVWIKDVSSINSNDTLPGVVVSKPTVSAFPYFDNFESGASGWTIYNGTLGSWALGTPAGTVINSAASGANAFMTNLTATYNNSDNSYVEGPCFDFSNMCNPVIELDIWWDCEFSWDGAVLQTSTNGGLTWQNVGAMGNPYNWYNDNTIAGNPGGQQTGWSGSGVNSSGGWVTARHQLNGLDSTNNVTIRIAFGADPSVNGFDGVAFDNVRIYDWGIDLPEDSYICTGDSLLLSVASAGGFPGSTILWSTGATSQGIWVDTTATYTVTVTSVGCISADSTFAQVIDTSITFSLGPDVMMCGESLLLDAGAHIGATYTWNTDDTTQTILATSSATYTVDVTTACATAADTMVLTINPIPVVLLNPYNYDTVCLNHPPLQLPAVYPTGGSYSGPGVSGSTFVPSMAGAGTFMTVYSYTDANECNNTDTSYITVDACVGLDEITNGTEINVYPNPNNGSFMLDVMSVEVNSLQVRITNTQGQLVYTRNWTQNPHEVHEQINLQDTPSGLYFVTVTTDKGSIVYKMTIL